MRTSSSSSKGRTVLYGLETGDWRTLNRVERGKHVELTLSVDPVSDDLLKSQGYTQCYGFGLVNVRPKNRHSVGVKDTAAEPDPGTASTTQVQEASQELPCCSKSIAPSSNTPEEQKEKAGGSTLEGLLTSAKAAKMERPATNAPQMKQLIRETPIHADRYGGDHGNRGSVVCTYTPWKVSF
ncbi:hypothetical protein ACLKA6_016077 [Drosophila palustris]